MSKQKETMESLDIKTLPLDGTVCIEASAGTGKTYTIGLIVLRLVMEQGLDAAKLAVVTFTEAAAGELAERIAEFLRIARDYAVDQMQNDEQRQLAKESKHSIIYDLVDAAILKEGEKVIVRLNGALLNYDLAQIITIHGFCLRLLNDFAFETGSAYGVEFVKDQDALINEILADFWRREISVLTPEVFRLLGNITPDTMREYYDSFLKHPHLEVKGPQLEKRVIEQYATSYATIHQQWIDSYDEINKILTEDANRFSQTSMKISRIPTYMDDVDDVFTSGKINREVMEVFSARQLQECLRSGSKYSIPSIPYLEGIDNYLDTYETLPDKITAHFLRLGYSYLRKELVSRKKELRIRTFDNMISDLSQSLAGANNTAAIDAIRQRFTAVLVDEFQDTDALQYSIFHTLFASYNSIFFAMIGDPKQAIYAFRGGDIHTYVAARDSVDPLRRFTLTNNFRSEPRLIHAMNKIYMTDHKDMDGNGPFLTKSIGYVEVTAKQDLLPPQLGDHLLAPVTVWNYETGKSPNESVVALRIARTIASYSDQEHPLMIGSAKKRRAVKLGDIAILVNSNDSAAFIKMMLGKYGIRSVIAKSGIITESEEADSTLLLMKAMMNPSKEKLVRALLVSDLFNYDLDALTEWEASDEKRLSTLSELNEGMKLWTERGVAAALNFLLARIGTLSMTDEKDLVQERKITNFRHLMEILHSEEIRVGRNPERLLNAFTQMKSGTAYGVENETQEQRLESDYDAVQIVTMHKSKGLQWPIVFAVDLWKSGVPKNAVLSPIYYEGSKRMADLDPDKYEEIREKIVNEIRQERMRLAYVAVTRAESLLYVVTADRPEKGEKDSVISDKSPSVLLFRNSKLKKLKDEKGELVQIEDLVENDEPIIYHFTPAIAADRPVNQWNEQRKLLPAWSITSYSGLTKNDEHRSTVEPLRDEAIQIPQEGIFAFPKGAEAGTVLHTIFERIDYINAAETDEPVPEDIPKTVNGILADAGFITAVDKNNSVSVLSMIRKVMNASIPEVGKGFRLGVLRDSERLNELEFHLSAAHPDQTKTPVSASELMQVIGADLGRVSDKRKLNGYLNGVIDLVFRYQGKWWIVDWKSNHLGNSPEFYDRDAMERSMREHNYHLQYHLYVVALVRYLRISSGGNFDYEHDFGGVLYIYLRGVDDRGNGIYMTRPSFDMITGLEKKL